MKLLNNFEQISRRTRVLYVGSVPRLRPLSKSTLSLEGVGLYTFPTRARFEDPCQDLFRSTLEPVEKVLRDAKIDKSNVHEIAFVSGSTCIPRIIKLVSDFINSKELNK